MKYLIIFRLTIIFLIGVSFSKHSYSQTTKIVTASCGKCGRSVPSTSSIGGTCPHCGVRWGRENKSTSTLRMSEKVITLPKFELDYGDSHSKTRSSSDESNLFERSTVIRNCKLRSSPGINSEILGLIAKNSSILINKRKGDWLKITYIGKLEGEIDTYVGWIQSSNVVEE